MAAPEPTSPGRRTAEAIALVVCAVAFVAATALVKWPEGAPAKTSLEGVGIIIAAGLTLIMYSFLYRDNPLFKIAENLYVGVALGYGAVLTWYLSLKPEIVDPLVLAPHAQARLDFLFARLRIIPIILGGLMLTRLSRRHGWLSRYTYTIMVGWGAGIGIPIVAHTYILQQVQPLLQPVWGEFWNVVGSLVVLIGTVTVLFYFFFSVEHRGAGGAVSRVGIWFLMVSFGASFGYTVMARVSLFIGRAQFLLSKWLGIPL